MINVLFICHGNICRSTMAESMFSHMLFGRGLSEKIAVDSAATHTDALGCPPHYGTRAKLKEMGVPLVPHRARLLTKEDGERFDEIVGMDEENIFCARRILGKGCRANLSMLLDWSPRPRAISDPWYTGDFDATYRDLSEGLEYLLRGLLLRNRELRS